MAGVAAFAIARFNSRRVRLMSWWLRMTLMRRDIVTILSALEVFGIFEFEDHKCNGSGPCDIPADRVERRLAQNPPAWRLAQNPLLGALRRTHCWAPCAEPTAGRLGQSGASAG
jgi:hypothetical protein